MGMLIISFIALVSVFCNVEKMLAQERFSTYGIDDIVEQFVCENEENVNTVEEIKHMLYEFAENPLNLNVATKEELELLPFLSPKQIENILFYIYNYGKMHSIYELRLIEEMDMTTIQLLTMFVTVENDDTSGDIQGFKNMFKYGKSEFYTRLSTGIQHKKGYDNVTDSIREKYPGSYYLGSPFYNSVRYRYYYKNNLSIGVVAEKDPGEEFFRNTNRKGYDFYSMHFYVGGIKWLKSFALGSYKANFGKGLVISNDFYMGKSLYAANMIGRNTGIKKHSSTDEVNFFHGIAGTVSFSNFEISMLYSFRKPDASVDNMLVTSFKKDGYHRLRRDIENRKSVNNNILGSNIKYKGDFFNIELTSVYNILNRMLKPENKVYNVFYPSGRKFFNLSFAYDFRWKNIFFSGETAIDEKGNIATLNSLNFYPTNGLNLFLIHRYYDMEYSSLTSSSFASGGMIQNESGIFMGMESSLSSMFKINLTFDSYRYPWLKYYTDKSSSGEEISSRITVSPGYNLSFYLDYRFRCEERDYTYNSSETYTLKRRSNRLKLYSGYVSGDVFSIKTYIDYSYSNIAGYTNSHGVALTQNISLKPNSLPVKISWVYSLFDTDDYDSRIYIYTKNLPYAFYFPSVYSRGLYFAGVVRYDFRKLLTLSFRYSITFFDDAEKIGSGAEEISGNKRDDIGFSVIVRF